MTHASSYFGLLDPAVQIKLNGPLAAVSGVTRIRDTREPEHHLPSAREFVHIALAGKAAEEEFLRRQLSTGQRLIPNPDGANDDLKRADATLAFMGIEDEREQLWREVTELVEQNWTSIQSVARLIFSSQHNEISRAALLQILSAP
ncbi:hypothetical protein [Paraburkholderia piptadeniae]|uniref:hypothetical protein n=1 Tax=Paraburkholderia piptadeniae TaxID=1701573 RepID=UPI00117DF9F0|nr:hypothetical protein [Paraburkholderia piptadeniae]